MCVMFAVWHSTALPMDSKFMSLHSSQLAYWKCWNGDFQRLWHLKCVHYTVVKPQHWQAPRNGRWLISSTMTVSYRWMTDDLTLAHSPSWATLSLWVCSCWGYVLHLCVCFPSGERGSMCGVVWCAAVQRGRVVLPYVLRREMFTLAGD